MGGSRTPGTGTLNSPGNESYPRKIAKALTGTQAGIAAWTRRTPRVAPPTRPAPEPRILVSLATYNEAGNVAALIAEIHKFVPQADVLVIDDNSPDGTWKIVEELGATDPRIKLLQRPGKLGLGTAHHSRP